MKNWSRKIGKGKKFIEILLINIRFLPNFKKVNIKKKKENREGKKEKKEYSQFPPDQLPRKEDI